MHSINILMTGHSVSLVRVTELACQTVRLTSLINPYLIVVLKGVIDLVYLTNYESGDSRVLEEGGKPLTRSEHFKVRSDHPHATVPPVQLNFSLSATQKIRPKV